MNTSNAVLLHVMEEAYFDQVAGRDFPKSHKA